MSTEVIEEVAKPIAEPAEPTYRYGYMPDGTPVDVGAGYKLVPEGEEIVRGDEYLHVCKLPHISWTECFSTVGKKAGLNTEGGDVFLAFRRKRGPDIRYGYRRNDPTKPINPGRGWRLLKIGETVESGDQFTRDDTTERLSWKGVRYGGATVCEGTTTLGIRRRIAKPSPAVTELAKPEPSKPLYGTIDFNNREAEKAEIRVLNELLDEYPRYYIDDISVKNYSAPDSGNRWVCRIGSRDNLDDHRFFWAKRNTVHTPTGTPIMECGWDYPTLWQKQIQLTQEEARAWLGRNDI